MHYVRVRRIGHRPVMLTLLAVSALALSGCSTATTSADIDAGVTSDEHPIAFTKIPSTAAVTTCGPSSAATVKKGTLTIATDSPAYEPWFVGDNPANGTGFEGAVAKAVAEKLGYQAGQVEFVRVPWDEAMAPGPKDFDFDINQFTIVGERRDAVDFSSPYYAVAQSIVAMSGTPAAAARNLNDLAPYRLGAQRGSTSLAAITGTIRPGQPPVEFDTTDAAKAALTAGTIDALVVDIPTGFQITKWELPNSALVGQFPRPNSVTEFFGLVLEKNSPMTPCASAAVDSLYADGTLDRLAQTWLIDTGDAPVLE
ncbi:polar amino acid transport system substrate-binding protein [Rhodococcus tukisamuensis]|uniref:Polar amino acid transport system substrate-binding protein n=2 Tax=Rhodococcus tukisamuensis TaxID=168276 RepID=A0A1G6PDY3_9NOCA|nr:polar amino acid transport system substrate-binding protein [Rhodococcus tukisamuensis]